MTTKTKTAPVAAVPADVESVGRKNSVLRIEIGDTVARMIWADGIIDELSVSALSSDVRQSAFENGLRQKLADAAAISRDPETGKSATVSQKRDRVRAVARNLENGCWTAPSRIGGTASSMQSRLAEALAIVNPAADREKITAMLATKTRAELSALALVPRVAAALAKMAESSGFNADAELAELGI